MTTQAAVMGGDNGNLQDMIALALLLDFRIGLHASRIGPKPADQPGFVLIGLVAGIHGIESGLPETERTVPMVLLIAFEDLLGHRGAGMTDGLLAEVLALACFV